ncbi:hypothetical protein BDZ45DRAFT_264051 [Acephala macrosclerotiorum]|nr:hypothetical protein BDZ45DRAFT_264051 [Acephala macrosclerotiorum]
MSRCSIKRAISFQHRTMFQCIGPEYHLITRSQLTSFLSLTAIPQALLTAASYREANRDSHAPVWRLESEPAIK